MTNGILLLDKPAGDGSFAALQAVKRALGTRRVGHTGTLDRFASGLLVVVCGACTRLASLVEELRKVYIATVLFGTATETLDPEGAITARGPAPSLGELQDALPAFQGEIMQAPPAYSALHVGGRRAHEIARAGGEVALAPRPVTVHQLDLLSYQPPRATLRITCGRGTYIRSLARDLAARLGTCAHVSALRRTRVGGFAVEEAKPPGAIDPSRDLLSARVLFERSPPLAALELESRYAARIASGVPPADDWFRDPPPRDGTFGAFDPIGGLAAVVRRHEGRWRLVSVFPQESPR